MHSVKRAQYQYPQLTKQTPKVSSLSKSGGDTPCINPIRGDDAKGALFQELAFTPVGSDFMDPFEENKFFDTTASPFTEVAGSPFTKVAEAWCVFWWDHGMSVFMVWYVCGSGMYCAKFYVHSDCVQKICFLQKDFIIDPFEENKFFDTTTSPFTEVAPSPFTKVAEAWCVFWWDHGMSVFMVCMWFWDVLCKILRAI